MRLHDLIVQTATAGLDLLEDGRMPPGHNGPYGDPETPVRNTAHWTITFLKAWEITQDEAFRNAVRRTTTYLCSNEARPEGFTFVHRRSADKDGCNGLIGQAWIIEALAMIAEHRDALNVNEEVSEVASEVFLLHPMNEKIGLWNRVDVDGTELSRDPTFNHQLWFAAAGGLLAPHGPEGVDERVRGFLDEADRWLSTYDSGLIRHPLPTQSRTHRLIRRTWSKLTHRGEKWRRKAIGYHSFNLYSFALLYNQYPQHDFWKTESFQDTLDYAQSPEYRSGIENNEFGFPYNPPGFEVAYVLDTFVADSSDEQRSWITWQLERCYDADRSLMTEDTEDEMTHAARFYEVTRVPDLAVELNNND